MAIIHRRAPCVNWRQAAEQGKRNVAQYGARRRQAHLGDGDFLVPRTIAKAVGLDDATRPAFSTRPPPLWTLRLP